MSNTLLRALVVSSLALAACAPGGAGKSAELSRGVTTLVQPGQWDSVISLWDCTGIVLSPRHVLTTTLCDGTDTFSETNFVTIQNLPRGSQQTLAIRNRGIYSSDRLLVVFEAVEDIAIATPARIDSARVFAGELVSEVGETEWGAVEQRFANVAELLSENGLIASEYGTQRAGMGLFRAWSDAILLGVHLNPETLYGFDSDEDRAVYVDLTEPARLNWLRGVLPSSAFVDGGNPAGSVCSNTCAWPSDGACDDGGPGAEYTGCEYGTDCADCGERVVQTACSNDCRWPSDGECDDGGPGSVTGYCGYGTDCADCGAR